LEGIFSSPLLFSSGLVYSELRTGSPLGNPENYHLGIFQKVLLSSSALLSILPLHSHYSSPPQEFQMSSTESRRRAEIEAKRAKLAELKRAREERSSRIAAAGREGGRASEVSSHSIF